MKCDISMSDSTVEGRPKEGMLAVGNMRTAYPCHLLPLCSCWTFYWVEDNIYMDGHKKYWIILDPISVALNKKKFDSCCIDADLYSWC